MSATWIPISDRACADCALSVILAAFALRPEKKKEEERADDTDDD